MRNTKLLTAPLVCIALLVSSNLASATTTLSSTKVGSTVSIRGTITGPTWLCTDKSPKVANRVRFFTHTLINNGLTATNRPIKIDVSSATLGSITLNGQAISGLTEYHEPGANDTQSRPNNISFAFPTPITVSTSDTIVATLNNVKLLETGPINIQVSLNTTGDRDWGCVQDKTTKFTITESGTIPQTSPTPRGSTLSSSTPLTSPIPLVAPESKASIEVQKQESATEKKGNIFDFLLKARIWLSQKFAFLSK